MAYQQDNVTYYGLKFDPRTPEEALKALKKISGSDHDAWKPDVARAALRYFSVFTESMNYCNWYQYLTGEVRGKMVVLTNESPKGWVNSQGYINSFSGAINLMIRRSEEYLEYKEQMDKNIALPDILSAKGLV